MYDSTERFTWQNGNASTTTASKYLYPSPTLIYIKDRKFIDDGEYLELVPNLTPDDYALLKLADITLDQLEYGELEDMEELDYAIYIASPRYTPNVKVAT